MSHRAISLAFGTWRTQFLAALKIVHTTWLSAGRGHHPGRLASALCRAGLSHCRARLCRRRRPLARPARLDPLPCYCPPVHSASLLLASPTNAWRPDHGRALPAPCSAPPWPCRHRVPRSRRQRLRGTTPGLPWLLARWSTACFAISSTSCCGVRGLVLPAGEPCRVSSFAAAAVRTAVGSTP